MTLVSVENYLQRIDYQGSLTPNLSTLNQLHLAHLQTVPFENLDISLNRLISLELPAILHKIVNLHRGGFCYELNTAFAWLIAEIGFPVELLSASTFDGKSLGPEFDHMLLMVETDHTVFADVGFGDSFLLPVFPVQKPTFQFDRYYRLESSGNRWLLQQRFETGGWKSLYIFGLKSHPVSDFEAMCDYHQTSKLSNFTRKTICSRATEKGRATYTNGRFILTEAGNREETIVESEVMLNDILKQQFGISLDANDLQRLISVAQIQRYSG
jgi:N-hydroxyarylamine O-acetyltransferase